MKIKDAEEQLLEVKGVFDSLKVPFWLSGGTLLAAVRDKKFFDWDHDIDLVMLDKDYYKGFEENFTGFRQFPIRYFMNRTTVFDLKKTTDLRFNIFIAMRNTEKGVYMKLAPPLVDNPKTLWKIEDVETPYYVDFIGEKFRVPNNPEKMLEEQYGKGWREPVKSGLSWRDHWVSLKGKGYLGSLDK